ncbi:MAG: pectin esterase [Lewinella sp.]|nr:pectin esterase [Lewinella sp.]
MRHLITTYLYFFLGWTTLSAQYATELFVAQDGSGEYTSIQAAIDATKSFPDVAITIHIKAGVYREKVKVHAWNNHLTLRGEDAATTVISWDDYFDSIDRGRNSTFHTPTLLVQGDDFTALNLTVENTAGPVGQAIALSVEADRAVFLSCRILGHQDTLYVDGAHARQYFRDCYIEGTTDFIFGAATVLFERCTIHSKANSFVTAASTPEGQPYGFVFLACRLTADEGVDAVYLGRPWRSYARTAFLRCELGAHIRPAGWDNWSTPAREQTTFYAEYENYGPGAQPQGRVPWSHQLSRRQARRYRTEKVLAPYLLPVMTLPN